MSLVMFVVAGFLFFVFCFSFLIVSNPFKEKARSRHILYARTRADTLCDRRKIRQKFPLPFDDRFRGRQYVTH